MIEPLASQPASLGFDGENGFALRRVRAVSQVAKQSTKYLEWLEYLVSLHLKEDYETLRHEAQELKADMRVDAATRALGVFFFEHTSAYVRWIITYDYELIRNR